MFGVRVPRSVEDAIAIDRRNSNRLWQDAIGKELPKVSVAWTTYGGKHSLEELRKGRAHDLVGYQEIKCHMIFDVKMSDLSRKAHFVAGGHMTEAPSSLTYSSIVSRDSVRIAFLLAALNGLDIQACDVSNAYLNAPCREKIWFEGGPECGAERGQIMIIKRALYGLKSSGAAWRKMLADSITSLGFVTSRIDPDVWLRANQRSDGHRYYEMLLVYVDDILIVSHKPLLHVQALQCMYSLKPESLGEPAMYLGANLAKTTTKGGTLCWSMSPNSYIAASIKFFEELLLGCTSHSGWFFVLFWLIVGSGFSACAASLPARVQVSHARSSVGSGFWGVFVFVFGFGFGFWW